MSHHAYRSLTHITRLSIQRSTGPLDGIASLQNLTTLVLSHCSLAALPSTLADMHVAHLDVSHNVLADIDVVTAMRALTLLDISHNVLSELPASLGQLTSLRQLHMGSNKLSVLPACVCALTALHTLVASHNAIIAVPSSIGALASLAHLDLSHNAISYIPHAIQNCVRIETLDLSSNRLCELPSGLGRLRRTRMLLRNNPLTFFPETMLHVTLLDVETLDPDAAPPVNLQVMLHAGNAPAAVLEPGCRPVASLQESCLRHMRRRMASASMRTLLERMCMPRPLIDAVDPPAATCHICKTELYIWMLSVMVRRPAQFIHARDLMYAFNACSSECLDELVDIYHR